MRRSGFVFAYSTAVLLPILCASAAAPGRQISDDYAMTADGAEVDVIRVPTPEPSSGGIKEGPDVEVIVGSDEVQIARLLSTPMRQPTGWKNSMASVRDFRSALSIMWMRHLRWCA